MVKLSTGLQRYLLSNRGFKELMEYGWIGVYSGEQPESPNNPVDATLLATITLGGSIWLPGGTNGLRFGQAADGSLTKMSDWRLKGIANGYAQWWRMWSKYADTGQLDLNHTRMDGQVGESLVLTDRSIVNGSIVTIDAFSLMFRG